MELDKKFKFGFFWGLWSQGTLNYLNTKQLRKFLYIFFNPTLINYNFWFFTIIENVIWWTHFTE